ncbi:hypothetical protein QYM36_019687, partial [Artemia franciscana]
MPRPQSHEELLTLLGMLNYLAKYIPDLSTTNKSLRDILKCEPFSWSPENDHTLVELKQSIVSGISFFNYKSLNVELKVNASSHGLGANLCNDGEVVAYASRALSKTKQKYSQLEKELYAVVYGCKHFYHYLYGRRVNVMTEHHPLETIVRNPIHKAPPRVQRLMLQLQPYDLHLRFRPGSKIPIADALSRLHLPDIDEKLAKEIDVYVHQISRHLPLSAFVSISKEAKKKNELGVANAFAELADFPDRHLEISGSSLPDTSANLINSALSDLDTLKSNIRNDIEKEVREKVGLSNRRTVTQYDNLKHTISKMDQKISALRTELKSFCSGIPKIESNVGDLSRMLADYEMSAALSSLPGDQHARSVKTTGFLHTQEEAAELSAAPAMATVSTASSQAASSAILTVARAMGVTDVVKYTSVKSSIGKEAPLTNADIIKVLGRPLVEGRTVTQYDNLKHTISEMDQKISALRTELKSFCSGIQKIESDVGDLNRMLVTYEMSAALSFLPGDQQARSVETTGFLHTQEEAAELSAAPAMATVSTASSQAGSSAILTVARTMGVTDVVKYTSVKSSIGKEAPLTNSDIIKVLGRPLVEATTTSGSEAGYTPPETTSDDLPISDNDLAKAPTTMREIASYLGRCTRKGISEEEFNSVVDDSKDRRPTEAIDYGVAMSGIQKIKSNVGDLSRMLAAYEMSAALSSYPGDQQARSVKTTGFLHSQEEAAELSAAPAMATVSTHSSKSFLVAEQIYAHSKILIVDDKTVICGSANINDRSLIGNKDSEFAMIFEDESDKTRFAASLRKALFEKHLGLVSKDLDDPTCDALNKKYREVAEANSRIYQQVFNCIPQLKSLKNSFMILEERVKKIESRLDDIEQEDRLDSLIFSSAKQFAGADVKSCINDIISDKMGVQLLFWLFPDHLKEQARFLRNILCFMVRYCIAYPVAFLCVKLPSSAQEFFE